MTDNQQTFDRIKQSAAYANRASRTLPTMGVVLEAGGSIAFIAAWCLVIVVIFAQGAFGIVAVLMVAFGIIALVQHIRTAVQYSNASPQAVPAIVVSKHSRSRGEYSSDHITLEFEDGKRQEYLIRDATEAALVGVGDEGVAFIRLNVFLAFDRVP